MLGVTSTSFASPSKHSRMGRFNRSMRRFSEVIDELELADLLLLGGNFTWSGGFHDQNQAVWIDFGLY